MSLSSSGEVGPVAMSWASMSAPDSAIASSAPSMRGWMFNWPGVAMNNPTLPSPTISTIRWPMAKPDP